METALLCTKLLHIVTNKKIHISNYILEAAKDEEDFGDDVPDNT